MKILCFLIIFLTLCVVESSYSRLKSGLLSIECETHTIKSKVICDINNVHATISSSGKRSTKTAKPSSHFVNGFQGTEVLRVPSMPRSEDKEIWITNTDDYNFTNIEIRESSFYLFPIEIFRQLPMVEEVTVDACDVHEMPNRLLYRQNTFLKTLKITDNKLPAIHYETFNGLTALETLSLKDNKITAVDSLVFRDTPNIKELDLSNNLLEEIDAVIFGYLKKLEHLDISDNKIKIIQKVAILQNTNLVWFYADDNKLETLELQLPPNVKGVFVKYNSLKNLSISGAAKLNELSAIYNDIRDLKINVDVKIVHMEGNDLKSLEPFKGLAVTSLYLASNAISNITGLKELKSLTKLELDGAEVEINSKTFADLSQLRWLSLESMKLKKVDVNWFKDLPQLSKLLLSRNYIKEFDYKEFAKLPSLTKMEVQYNEFSCSYYTEMIKYLNSTSLKLIETYSEDEDDGLTCVSEYKKAFLFTITFIVLGTLTVFISIFVVLVKVFGWKSKVTYRPSSNVTSDEGTTVPTDETQ